MDTPAPIHASCVCIHDGQGVLLLGPPGSGKSDLALRLIEDGAVLVSDDYTELTSANARLMASPPKRLEGLLELRGVGICTFDFERNIPVKLAIQLVTREQVERLPHKQLFDCQGLQLPLLSLHAFDVSTPAKIRLALQQLE